MAKPPKDPNPVASTGGVANAAGNAIFTGDWNALIDDYVSKTVDVLLSSTSDTSGATAVQGDLLLRNNSSKWDRLAKGTNSNFFLGIGGVPTAPIWKQPSFSNLSGTLAAGQIPSPYAAHGHAPNSGLNPLISNALAADKTITGTTAATVGIQVSATARDAAQGLNAFFGAILAVQSPLGTGQLWVYIDGAQYAGPYPVGNATYSTITLYVPFFAGDANAHTFDIYANADTALHTIVFSGTTYQTIDFVVDLGTGTNIA